MFLKLIKIKLNINDEVNNFIFDKKGWFYFFFGIRLSLLEGEIVNIYVVLLI